MNYWGYRERPSPPWEKARVKKSFRGKFSRWRKGELVWVLHYGGGYYTVDRDKWSGSMVSLCNVIHGVHRSQFKFVSSCL